MPITVFDALASTTRRQLIEALAWQECNVSTLVKISGISQPAVSQQLNILRDAGLLKERQDGRFRFYCLQGEPLQEVAEWIDHYRIFWSQRLDTLGNVLNEMNKQKESRRRKFTKKRGVRK